MQVFVYEFASAAEGRGEPLPASIRAEGRAMFTAVRDDLGRVPGVWVVTLPVGAADEEAAFRALARGADATLVVAPESDGILLRRCRWVEEAGGRLLGPSSAAVRLAGDKRALGQHWAARGVPSPPCEPVERAGRVTFPAVLKPRDGAGSQATFLVGRPEDLEGRLAAARAEGFDGRAVLQPFVPGTAASVAFLVGPRQTLALPPADQFLSSDGRFRYRGGRVPLPADLAGRATEVAWRAAAAVEGLRGYVGVDVVLGDAADGSGDAVIELNPRLTTSYLGLRALASDNLAGVWLRVASGDDVTPPAWRPGEVAFRAARA